ncbi:MULTISPECIES: AAA family ATPase [Acinetobacter]|uniref:AAA family ATPase n=1 Tax=Acinetobacter TaxID=469 RepID=UPI001F60F754|nr:MULTISPECIES: AAA family ATPase [Acinetobacter]UNT44429.1 ATP-binding protein [Acinetobacter sp. LUNF3]
MDTASQWLYATPFYIQYVQLICYFFTVSIKHGIVYKFQKMENIKLIITKISLKNWYSFKDCSLDLSYPRRIVDSTVPFEYLENFENIRFKRVIILSGANATGKTSFAKILVAIRNFISKGELSKFFYQGFRENDDVLEFEVEFIDRNPDPETIDCSKVEDSEKVYDFYHRLKVIVSRDNNDPEHLKLTYNFCYKAIEIKKIDSVETLRGLLDEMPFKQHKARQTFFIDTINDKPNQKDYLEKVFKFQSLNLTNHWNFLYNDHNDDVLLNNKASLTKDTLEAVLKTFDPSILSVQEAHQDGKQNDNGFFANFYNGNQIYISNDGQVLQNKHFFSLGTYESIKIANFVSLVLSTKNKRGCTFFLDEGMSYVQSEIERNIVNLILQKMNRYSQFFYTTHNYDVLDMNLPIHSYLFIRKDDSFDSQFIRAEQFFKKNDRSIVNYIKNDVLGTLPDTRLLDDLLMGD